MSPELINILEKAAYVISVVAVIATVVAKLTPDPKDDGVVKKISDIIFMVIAYLPTFGVNPKTKKLEEMVKQLQKQLEEKKDV